MLKEETENFEERQQALESLIDMGKELSRVSE